MKKQKKRVQTVFVDLIKVDLNEFPNKYIKNIVFKNCDIKCEFNKKISTNIVVYSSKGQLHFSHHRILYFILYKEISKY